jgi:2',3'-cyclic-nucleotide 2'-phosphodiesterase (5'-nucleotidase family)
MSSRLFVVVALVCAACTPARAPAPTPVTPPPITPAQAKPGAVTLTILGTNDLHGAIARLPLLAGYVNNVRAARQAEGGGVVLVDAGDMFQGTLESNLREGADVVRAYNAIGYTAAAVGNHEFDFGPAGAAATPEAADDDPRGALKARAAEAKFPLLAVNVVDRPSGARIKWPNMPASTLVEVAGISVGIIGASTESTPFTTMAQNFAGLAIAPPARAIADEARALRARGARVIVVTAHIGSRCKNLENPADTSSCDTKEELFELISGLPSGLVDVIVAGHTHAAIAHRVSDIAVIESYSSGRAFGRVDLRIAPDGHVTAVKIAKPHLLCTNEGAAERDGGNPIAIAACVPGTYEGAPVVADPAVQQIADEALARAAQRRAEPLNVTLAGAITKSYGTESAEGNWFTDLMLAANPGTEVAVTNGGGLRADLPAGPLTYGGLFEAMPFDNRFALLELTGAHIQKLISSNLSRGGAILSWGGLAAKARCANGVLAVAITVGGKPLVESRKYKVVTSDFLASGGDGLIGRLKIENLAITISPRLIRDAMAEVIRTKLAGKTIDPAQLVGPAKKRMNYEGQRPVSCGAAASAPREEPD